VFQAKPRIHDLYQSQAIDGGGELTNHG
jgi:hypothetical protein